MLLSARDSSARCRKDDNAVYDLSILNMSPESLVARSGNSEQHVCSLVHIVRHAMSCSSDMFTVFRVHNVSRIAVDEMYDVAY